MKLIPLTQGKFAMVDDEDYDYLMQWKWQAHTHPKSIIFYAVRSNSKKTNGKKPSFKMHREIMGCKLKDGKIIDHIDGNGLNNQKSNLRLCTQSQNSANRLAARSSTSKYLGVSTNEFKIKHKLKNGKIAEYNYFYWFYCIAINGKRVFCGRFKTEKEAALAYNVKATELYGEFARLNIVI